MINWGEKAETDWLGVRIQVLHYLGLQLIQKGVTEESLLKEIRLFIDQRIPVLLIAKYSEIFYLDSYMDASNQNPHALVISDYSSDRGTVLIRDGVMNRLRGGNIMSRLHLT